MEKEICYVEGTITRDTDYRGNSSICIPGPVREIFDDLYRRYPALLCCKKVIYEAFEILAGCWEKGGKLLICGNGGSASDSEHIAGEMMKGFRLKRGLDPAEKNNIEMMFRQSDRQRAREMAEKLQRALPVIPLVSNTAFLTAFSNDVSPDMSFAQQVYGYGKTEDALIGITTSGNSAGVVNALMAAKINGIKTIGLTGKGGGLAGEYCDVLIAVPEIETYKVQEYHLPVYHALCAAIEESFFGAKASRHYQESPGKTAPVITNNKKSLIATGDVIVLGGGPAGICAAIAAARRGAAVTLVEKSGCLGGMATLGLVGPIAATKSNSGNDFGGIMRELLDKISETARDICLADSFPEFSPPSARYVFLKTLLDEGVNILFHSLVTGAEAEGGRLRSVELQTKGGARIVEGKVFVDCTGDGDLMEYTGIPYIMGSEAESIRMLEENRLDKIHEMEGSKAEKYINKLQPVSNMFIMGNVNIDDAKGYINRELTFDGLGIPCDEFLKQPYIIDMEGFEPFEDSDRIPLPQGRILFFRTARKGEVVINMTRVRGIDGTDPIQLSHGEIISQLQAYAIIKFLRKYIKGFESSYLIEFAPSTGVRETRRLKGKYVLTADDAINCRKFSDAIACGSYIIDIHDPVGRNKALGGRIKGDCYDIPYRSLICEKMKNILFAGRCISCDHVAHSSLRVMGTCMLTGQAAGTAAAISISKEGTAGDVTLLDGIVIRKCLEADGVRIM